MAETLRSKSSAALSVALERTGSHLFHGPTWMSRLTGQMPHEEARGPKMKQVAGCRLVSRRDELAILADVMTPPLFWKP